MRKERYHIDAISIIEGFGVVFGLAAFALAIPPESGRNSSSSGNLEELQKFKLS